MPRKKPHRYRKFHRPRRWKKVYRRRKPRQGNVCSHCGRKFTELPYRCNYCGKYFCSEHHLPEAHACKGLGRRKRIEPVREPPTWVPAPAKKFPRYRFHKTIKAIGKVLGGIAALAIITVIGLFIWAVFIPWLGDIIGEIPGEIIPGVQTESMPPDYYNASSEYVANNYGEVEHQTYIDLIGFLMMLETFPEYDWDEFTCSKASALLEWLLEGAGFNAQITLNYHPSPYILPTNAHAWVIVELNNGESVSVEATWFTEGYYNPPAIVSGSLPTIWGDINYDEPVETFDSLDDVVERFRSDDGWDWWNVAPYNSIVPFSEWD